MKVTLPTIRNDFFCIADTGNPVLAAVTLSYLATPGSYMPFFEMPIVNAPASITEDEDIDEYSISRSRGQEFDVRVGNCIRAIGGAQNLILVGLTPEQKSYLSFLEDYYVIEVDALDDVETMLNGFAINLTTTISCRSDNIIEGLFQAVETNSKLTIDDNAAEIKIALNEDKKGLIIIEKTKYTSPIIALNFAIAVKSIVCTVAPLGKNEANEILFLIEDWQNGSNDSKLKLQEKVNSRVKDIKFINYEWCTFFTNGLPYTFVIGNVIPFSYVNLLQSPDLFIFNNIYTETIKPIGSGIVFSPLTFQVEEIEFILRSLRSEGFYVKELTGKNATVFNIEMCIGQFPFDIFHICSHGGEVGGYNIVLEFQDRTGANHTIEYDEVVSFAPNGYEDLIMVTSKYIFRKFNGFRWRSEELDNQNYPKYVYADMNKAIANKDIKKNRKSIENVVNSCAIKCWDFNYQAMTQVIAASYTSPIIFNNTCYSWIGISDFLLNGGAKGYVGTFGKVGNTNAVAMAEAFYSKIFEGHLISAFYSGINEIKGTVDENNYIFWGLPCSYFHRPESTSASRFSVFTFLLDSIKRWRHNISTTSSTKIRNRISSINEWLYREIFNNFNYEYKYLVNKLKMAAAIKRSNISRNEICYCGSGKKFKRCHGK